MRRSTAVRMLRLHVSDLGTVWFAHDRALAEDSGLGAHAFVATARGLGVSLDRPEAVRVLGTAPNALLAILLDRAGCRVELASPALVAASAGRRDPATVLQALWQPEPQAMACGGIHALTPPDLRACELMAAVRSGDAGEALRALPRHPAWPALSFLPFLSPTAAACLLTEIVDPRWFRHPSRPHRVTRLLSYLGVTPANMAAFATGGEPDRHASRASLAVGCWFTAALDQRPDDPRNFLWRVYAAEGGGVDGLLHACRRFVRFLYEVWLDSVSAGRPEQCFSPRGFFKSEPEEEEAWAAHVAGLADAQE